MPTAEVAARQGSPHPLRLVFPGTPPPLPLRAHAFPGVPLSPAVAAPLQNVENFTLARNQAGNVLLEDGKGRCPFDPNFKSTALMVGECWRRESSGEAPWV